jgi:hypothetical protein
MPMKRKSDISIEDELRPEYDFGKLRVVARGPGRQASEGPTIQLEPDVAEMFPDSRSVNEALRLLIRAARKQNALSK